jgi:cobalt-zinc-cadmium efflux system protein
MTILDLWPAINRKFFAQPDSARNIKIAFFLNFGFTLLEIVGGLLTNSLAILSDALHDMGDSLSLGLAWYLNRYAKKGKDREYSYGYGRFSLLSALVNAVILIGGSLYLLSQAIPRLFDPEPSSASGMLLLAIGGIVVNGLAVLRLKGGRSLNVQVVAWHLLEDVLGWVAILIVSIVLFFTDLYILDPILSILITLYVLYNMLGKLKQTLSLFLQAVPGDVDLNAFESQVLTINQVIATHHTHIWSLEGEHHVLSTHVVVAENATKEDIVQIKDKVRSLIDLSDFEHITVEIEYENESCALE